MSTQTKGEKMDKPTHDDKDMIISMLESHKKQLLTVLKTIYKTQTIDMKFVGKLIEYME